MNIDERQNEITGDESLEFMRKPKQLCVITYDALENDLSPEACFLTHRQYLINKYRNPTEPIVKKKRK